MQESLARRISEIMFPGGAGSSGIGFIPVEGKGEEYLDDLDSNGALYEYNVESMYSMQYAPLTDDIEPAVRSKVFLQPNMYYDDD